MCSNAVMRIAGMGEMNDRKKGDMDADTRGILKDLFERGANHYARSMAMAAIEDDNYVLGMASHAARLGMDTQQNRDFVTEVARGLVMGGMDKPEHQSALDSMITDPRTNNVLREAAVESSSDVNMLRKFAFMDNEKCDAPRYQEDADESKWREAYNLDELRFAARRRLRDMGLLPEADFMKGISYTHSAQ